MQPIFSLLDDPDPHSLVLTFDSLISRTDFVPVLKFLLETVEQHYGRPVDIEFAVSRIGGRHASNIEISLLQCRPLSYRREGQPLRVRSR